MRALWVVSLALFVIGWPGLALAMPLEELVASARGSVVHVSERSATNQEIGNGSGFVVSADGKIATNYHVIERAGRLVAVFAGGKEVEITGVWAADPSADLAILQLAGGGYRGLRLAEAPAKQGASIVVIGSPLGLSDTVSTGIVSAVRERGPGVRKVGDDLSSWGLQITAATSPGSSGSPVLDQNGEVVGVVVGIRTGGQALNFAVPVKYLRELLQRAESTSELTPLGEASGARSVADNLLISAAVLAAVVLLWWIVGRRSGKQRKGSLERYGL